MSASQAVRSSVIVVRHSKTKAFLLLVGSVGFVAAGVALFLFRDPLELPFAVILVASWMGVPFFLLCGTYALSRVFSNAPALVIDGEGIVDNGSGVSAGRILWSEIEGLQAIEFMGNNFLAVSLTDPEAVLARQNPLKRRIMRTNWRMAGFPVSIPEGLLPVPVSEVLDHIRDHFGMFQTSP